MPSTNPKSIPMQTSIVSKPVFGLRFSLQKRVEVVADVLATVIGSDHPCRLLITPNVDHIVTIHNNPQYREACNKAWKLTVDGFPVAKVLAYVGVNLPERVTGADLFPDIMRGLSSHEHRPAFLVATEQTKTYLENWLLDHGFSSDQFYVQVPPFGFQNNLDFSGKFLANLNSLGATHLFMGVGAPKSEIWALENFQQLNGVCVLCFGAGIEFFTGNLQRAPEWMQNVGLEWFWRLCSEPRRLARRYLVNSWKFFYYATREIIAQRRERSQ